MDGLYGEASLRARHLYSPIARRRRQRRLLIKKKNRRCFFIELSNYRTFFRT